MDAAIAAFRRCFPRNARPSSRAAYLFSYDGPLPRSTFEAALDATDDALGETGGPFFCGDAFSAPDGRTYYVDHNTKTTSWTPPGQKLPEYAAATAGKIEASGKRRALLVGCNYEGTRAARPEVKTH